MAMETAHPVVQTSQIQEAIKLAEKMNGRDRRLKIERADQSCMNLLHSEHREHFGFP